jgi:hypothetical protein
MIMAQWVIVAPGALHNTQHLVIYGFVMPCSAYLTQTATGEGASVCGYMSELFATTKR